MQAGKESHIAVDKLDRDRVSTATESGRVTPILRYFRDPIAIVELKPPIVQRI